MDTNPGTPEIEYAFDKGVLTAFGEGWTATMQAWPEPWIEVDHHGGHWAEEYEYNPYPHKLGSKVLYWAECMAEWIAGDFGHAPIEPADPAQGTFPIIRHISADRDYTAQPGWMDAFYARFHLSAFWDTIPSEIRSMLYGDSRQHWLQVCVFRYCPHAADLRSSNPFLLHTLIDHYAKRHPSGKLPYDEIEAWMLRKQVDLMEFLELPASETNRRLLTRLPDNCYTSTLYMLRLLETYPEMKRVVQHLPQLRATLIHVLANAELHPHLSGPFVTEFAMLDDEYSITTYYNLLNDTCDLLRRAGMKDRKLYSVKALERIHDDILHRLGPAALMMEWERECTFPRPPYAGTEHIVPITSPESLFREGLEMRHCAAIYAASVSLHESYLYQVLQPVRATLQIKRNADGVWTFYQMQGKCNQAITQQIIADTLEWLWGSAASETAAPRQVDDDRMEAWEQELADSVAETTDDTTQADSCQMGLDFDPQLPLLPPEELLLMKRVAAAFM